MQKIIAELNILIDYLNEIKKEEPRAIIVIAMLEKTIFNLAEYAKGGKL